MMKEKLNLPIISLIVLVVWAIIVLGGEILQAGQSSLDALVTEQIVISLIIAPIFLFGVVAYFKWSKIELGLKPAQKWHILILPALFVLAFMGIAAAIGLPPTSMIVFALINSLLVGIAEELMFRGIIFRGALALPRVKIWSAIWITSLLFGAIHSLNGFLTGEFLPAIAQAFAAIISGVWLHAIRLRTKSLYPVMLIHALWDFSIFLMAASVASGGVPTPNTNELSAAQQLLPALILPLPLFFYGLWLLRGIGKKDKAEILA